MLPCPGRANGQKRGIRNGPPHPLEKSSDEISDMRLTSIYVAEVLVEGSAYTVDVDLPDLNREMIEIRQKDIDRIIS